MTQYGLANSNAISSQLTDMQNLILNLRRSIDKVGCAPAGGWATRSPSCGTSQAKRICFRGALCAN